MIELFCFPNSVCLFYFVIFADDHQKKLRKQKILINKLRRHGTLPPEDTYAVSENDIKQTYGGVSPQDIQSLRKQYPHLAESEIRTLYDAGHPEPDTKKGIKCEFQSKLCKYQPWQDLEDFDDIVARMDEQEKSVLVEMNMAHDNSAFLSNTHTRLKNLPKNPTEVFNIADGFVRRIIKVAKQLKFFHEIAKDDQIALLKGSVVEIMMLRSAVNFDVRTETWTLSTSIKTGSESASDMSSPGSAGSVSEPFDFTKGTPGLDINKLREAAMKGADLNTLRNMAHGVMPSEGEKSNPSTNTETEQSKYPVNVENMKRKYGLSIEQMKNRFGSNVNDAEDNLASLRNAAAAAGFDVNALRQAAMNGASFAQLSQMAHASQSDGKPPTTDVVVKQEVEEGTSNSAEASCISSEILKNGNPETKTMFLTYSKFIRSLMSTIFGDLMILKFLIMLSLFSPDRQGLENKALVERFQEIYVHALKKYIEIRYSEEKNMFARCIMKLTDLRNVNEVHTKMLLKMHVEDIEPLLVEMFDLPQ